MTLQICSWLRSADVPPPCVGPTQLKVRSNDTSQVMWDLAENSELSLAASWAVFSLNPELENRTGLGSQLLSVIPSCTSLWEMARVSKYWWNSHEFFSYAIVWGERFTLCRYGSWDQKYSLVWKWFGCYLTYTQSTSVPLAQKILAVYCYPSTSLGKLGCLLIFILL